MCENSKEVDGVGGGLESVKSKRSRTSCFVCYRFITDPSMKAKGQDSVFYDCECKGWLHRVCAGLTKLQLSNISSSPKPFFCQHCSRSGYEEEIIRGVGRCTKVGGADCLGRWYTSLPRGVRGHAPPENF